MSQFVEAVHAHTHIDTHILSPTKASVSVCLSVRCSTNRGERGRQTEGGRQKRGGRGKKRERKETEHRERGERED